MLSITYDQCSNLWGWWYMKRNNSANHMWKFIEWNCQTKHGFHKKIWLFVADVTENHRNVALKSVMSCWCIVIGVPLWVCGRNLTLQQLTWSGVMSISAAIHILHLYIRRVNRPGKTPWYLILNAKFDFKSTWNRDWATSRHKHPVCQFSVGDAEKLTNVWSRYLERIGLLTTGTVSWGNVT